MDAGSPSELPVHLEAVCTPRSPLRLPRASPDGTTRVQDGTVVRLVHPGGRPAVVTLRRRGEDVLLAARADEEATATAALSLARRWSAVDDDVGPFLRDFDDDPLIGASVRDAPGLRPYRRPTPYEVLLGAVCEQLVDDERAQAIKRAIVRRHGRRHGDLRDAPDARTVARLPPAELERCGLAAQRATALLRATREVAAGRVDLEDPDRRTDGWRRLRGIPGIGPWTLSVLALHGQGHLDALPAGDHALRMIVGEVSSGRPRKAEEADVVAFFAPYAGWRGMAAWHALRTGGATLRRRAVDAGRVP